MLLFDLGVSSAVCCLAGHSLGSCCLGLCLVNNKFVEQFSLFLFLSRLVGVSAVKILFAKKLHLTLLFVKFVLFDLALHLFITHFVFSCLSQVLFCLTSKRSLFIFLVVVQELVLKSLFSAFVVDLFLLVHVIEVDLAAFAFFILAVKDCAYCLFQLVVFVLLLPSQIEVPSSLVCRFNFFFVAGWLLVVDKALETVVKTIFVLL